MQYLASNHVQAITLIIIANIEILKNTTAIDADSSFKPKFVLEIVSLNLTSTSSILGEVFKPDSS